MPTELPSRRTEPPQSTRAGNLAFAIAVVMMLAISAALLLLHPSGAAANPVAMASRTR